MQPGRRLQHYVLIEQIGQGGQAAVWSAEDEQLKRTVAIKTINLAAAPDEMGNVADQALRFENEARIIAELEHPYILPIYTYGRDGDWLYIVMRYMAGGTLHKLIKNEPLDPERALALARPLADALDLAHLKQIIHRDIKSVNILLDAQNRPYLADFGLSVTTGQANDHSSGSGTLAYMSPEQLRGEMTTPRSDLYSFGMLIYEMLTGATPTWNGQNWNLAQVMNMTALPIPANMPPDIANILRRALAVDPNERYETAMQLIDALHNAIAPTAAGTKANAGDDFFLLPVNDPALMALNKANDLFDTALSAWADGAGRFRLYADDFKYIDSFYSDSHNWDLALSEPAKRLMLRAALEHGYKLDSWWKGVTGTSDKRAVALQTLISELPSARIRAIEYLTLIDDSDPPAIPTRVASIIGKDLDAEVRQAGVYLLEERARPAKSWHTVSYDEFIDETLADLAAHDIDARISEAAARTCGRIRSVTAVMKLAKLAGEGDARALRALVYIRDEVPNLPSDVPRAVRWRILAQVSCLQFWSRQLAYRYIGGVVAGAIGIGGFVYWKFLDNVVSYSSQFAVNAVANGFAFGLSFGLILGAGLTLAIEPADRLRAWSRPARIVLSIVLAGLISALVFVGYRAYYYNVTDPFASADVPWYFGGAFLFTAGLAIASGLSRRPLVRALVGAAAMFLAVYGVFRLYLAGTTAEFLLDLSTPNNDPRRWLIQALYVALTLSFIVFLPEWLAALRRRTRKGPMS
ncbi:MAG: bifunctional serine/threonine protein kinase/MFS transporter [Aggregatilineales bacterium]